MEQRSFFRLALATLFVVCGGAPAEANEPLRFLKRGSDAVEDFRHTGTEV